MKLFLPALIAGIFLIWICTARAAPGQYFGIQVVDEVTGRGVPMVELQTTSGVRYYTDSNGLIAFYEPGLMNKKVWFGVSSHGYEFPPDGLGIRGVTLQTRPGAGVQLKIKRLNIAERLYRITGQGIYRDTVLLGRMPPIAEPLLNAQVTGQDGILNAIYHGKLFWFYGDTSRLSYALGNFHMTGATTELPDKIDPSIGFNLRYFTGKDGFAKPMVPMAGEGVVWLSGLVVLPDPSGRERMLAYFQRRRGLGPVLENGFVVYNDEKQVFEKLKDVPLNPPLFPTGYPFRVNREAGTEYLYFTAPYPTLRVRADWNSYLDLSSYEGYTCLMPGTRGGGPDHVQLDRVSRITAGLGTRASGLRQENAKTRTRKRVPGESAKSEAEGGARPTRRRALPVPDPLRVFARGPAPAAVRFAAKTRLPRSRFRVLKQSVALRPGRPSACVLPLDRDPSGKLVWAWKKDTPPLKPQEQQALIAAGKMKREESPFRLQDAGSGRPILLNNCSCFWNDYRRRYIMIASEVMGATMLGEVWYSEAEGPEGPWVQARKIITHANKPGDAHDFYNPTQHPFFDQDGGRVIYLEGSYVNTFSGNPHPTPYYEYNQIMYRLDLSDPRLRLLAGPPHQPKPQLSGWSCELSHTAGVPPFTPCRRLIVYLQKNREALPARRTEPARPERRGRKDRRSTMCDDQISLALYRQR